jgi:hypothetical protein
VTGPKRGSDSGRNQKAAFASAENESGYGGDDWRQDGGRDSKQAPSTSNSSESVEEANAGVSAGDFWRQEAAIRGFRRTGIATIRGSWAAKVRVGLGEKKSFPIRWTLSGK